MNSLKSFDLMSKEYFYAVSGEKLTELSPNFQTRVAVENGYFGRIDGNILSKSLQKDSGWSADITDSIRAPAEYRIYREAKLIDTKIGGRRALARNDINWFQETTVRKLDASGQKVDVKMTNLQRIENGYAPLDTNGQSIELHHIGQKRNSPIAELTIKEHRLDPPGNSKILHPSSESDVHRDGDNWAEEKKQYWKDRAEADITQRQKTSLTVKMAHRAGVMEGASSAMITGAISTVNNVRDLYNGEITVQEAAANIAVEAGTAAALGYGTGFISSAVATAASNSAHAAVRTLGSAGLPAAAISFGIASYDSVIDFAQGEIDGTELAHNLAENATGVAGAIGGAKVGAVAGAVVAGPAGAVVGGLVGGMVGYAVTTAAYATVIDVASNGVSALTDRAVAAAETAIELKERATELGQGVLDFVTTNAPEALDTVKSAMTDLASNLRVSLNFG